MCVTCSFKLTIRISITNIISKNYAKKIAKISNECKVEVDEHKYIESFCPGLMNVVYQWCSGATFKQILEDTEIFEGKYFL